MMSAIGTIISSISLLLQLVSTHDKEKVKELQKYKESLRFLVSILCFSKMMHALAHEMMDLNFIELFEKDSQQVSIESLQKSFNSSFGYLLSNKMNKEIKPILPRFKSEIMRELKSYSVVDLSNNFINAVDILNYSYPKMIEVYEDLYSVISEVHKDLDVISNRKDYSVILSNYSRNKEGWKHYISTQNRELLTYADQNILNLITILDTLFMV